MISKLKELNLQEFIYKADDICYFDRGLSKGFICKGNKPKFMCIQDFGLFYYMKKWTVLNQDEMFQQPNKLAVFSIRSAIGTPNGQRDSQA